MSLHQMCSWGLAPAADATGLASGTPLMHTAALATCMASPVVTRMGNTPIEIGELCETMEKA